MSTEAEQSNPAVALIGMAGRFPEAPSVAALWANLVAGKLAIRPYGEAELLEAGVDPARLYAPGYVKAGSRLAEIEQFDAAFFGYTPREAELMDPQHRLFLECAWEALELAAYAPDTFRGLIGVFAGSGFSTYMANNLLPRRDMLEMVSELQIAIGNERDSLASTVSYKLNLRGPSIAVQTFCSTSLVAVHLACQSLLTYDSDLALAGGVAISVPQGHGYQYEEGGILSPDGACRTFDAAAQGSVMGSGVGVVALKRLDDALADGDTIYAVIRGSAVNNDGLQRVGYTAPGLNGQAAVIAEGIASAQIEPADLGYIEAHGTATPLGDAIELAALHKVFQGRPRATPCLLGSLKPNLGHLDRASGVTGLIKAALALHHQCVPPQQLFQQPAPDSPLRDGLFQVPTALTPWPRGPRPRFAAVNSFGMGGTNAHVVLEEAPLPHPAPPLEETPLLLPLSAKTPSALARMALRLAEQLEHHPEQALGDVAFTLQVGRSAFNERLVVLGRNRDELLAALRGAAPARRWQASQPARQRPLTLFLPPADPALAALGPALYAADAQFRAIVDGWERDLPPLVLTALRPLASGGIGTPTLPLDLTGVLVQLALVELLRRRGARPQRLVAWGSGVASAAVASGALALPAAIELLRGHRPNARLAAPTIAVELPIAGVFQAGGSDPAAWEAALGCQEPPIGAETLRSAAVQCWIGSLPAELNRGDGIALLDAEALAPELLPLATLGRLWLAGVELDWAADATARRRVPLPTYPFERQRFWIDAPNAEQEEAVRSVAPAEAGRKEDPADWFYRPVWTEAMLLPPPSAAEVGAAAPWLIFSDGSALAGQIEQRLAAAACQGVIVQPGHSFSRLGANRFALRPGEESDYQRLFAALGAPPRTILHLWGCGVSHGVDQAANVDQVLEQSFYSLLALTRAIGRRWSGRDITLWAFTRELHRVTGGETLAPEQALTRGAAMVIAQENLSLVCRQVDLGAVPSGGWQERRLVDALLGELIAAPVELAVAYRGHTRWVQGYTPLALPRPQQVAFRKGGVYLITGGLGGVGLAVARHLAEQYGARLVLTARGGLPPREVWERRRQRADPDDAVAARIEAVCAIEALGGDVLVVQANVARQNEMEAAVALAYRRFGALHGVIHAAGTSESAGFGTAETIGRAGCELHFEAKVHGLLALEAVLGGLELDFVLLCSSLAAVLGGLGFVAYAAANAYMDAYAAARSAAHPEPWIAVNWDTWQVRENPHGLLGATVDQFAMRPHEAIDALERIISTQPPLARVVNCTGDLHARLDQWVRELGARRDAADALELHPRPELSVPYLAPANETEECIAAVWGELLGLAEVGVNDNFLELGGNSLVGTQLVSRLRQLFQASIPLTILFEAPTVAELAVAIELLLIEQLEQLDEAVAGKLLATN